MVLDHYNRTISAGRSATVKEIKELLQSLKAVSESAGPIAEAEAQKAIQKLIDDASDKIAKTSAEKSITTADRISRRQIIIASIAGGVIATAIAVTAAMAMYLVLDQQGICSETPFMQNATQYCVVDRSLSQ
jgi:Flp pilus assembly protein TadB